MSARTPIATPSRTRIALLAALAVALLAFLPAHAGAVVLPKTSAPLPGSSFQAGDGNQKTPAVGDADYDALSPLVDWQTALGTTTHYPDPNAGDNIFAGGSAGKSDNPDLWAFANQDGGSTPGKNNILSAYSRIDPNTSDTLLYLAFTRGDPNGTTFMGFELNRRADLWTNAAGATIPCRTSGDIIVTAQASGNDIDLVLQTWTTKAGATDPLSGCAKEGTLSDFDAFTPNVDAQGHMNETAITNHLPSSYTWPGGQIPEKLFGEAALNLSTILEDATGSPCFSFGSIWMHTRASTADDSNMDDYIAPSPLLVRNCTASGTKFEDLDGDGARDAAEPGLSGFRIWADYDEDGVRDAGEPYDDTDADGSYEITNLQDPSGTYALREQLTSGSGATDGWICTAPASTGPGGDFACGHTGISGATTPNASGRDFGNWKPPTIEVVKQLEPSGDGGRFDLGIDATTPVTDVGDGGTTGARTVGAGPHTVGEAAHAGTTLANYDTSLTCTGKAGLPAGETPTGTTRTSSSFSVGSRDAIVCTFTNTRRTGSVTVIKDVRPDDTDQDDTGRFDIDVEGGTLDLDEAADGDDATATVPPAQDVSITETEDGDDTDLSKYDTSISCANGGGQPVVTQGTSAEIDVASGDAWVCTVINTRRTGTIEVEKVTLPADDDGHFDLYAGDEAGPVAENVQNGGSGSDTVQPGTYDVSEAGNATDLAGYLSTVECTKNGQPYIGSHPGTRDEVTVDSNDVVHCTFTNTRMGTVKITKSVPDVVDTTSFAFSGGALTGDFSLEDGGTTTVTGVTPNAGGDDYVVNEPNVDGYRVKSVSCDDDDSDGVRSQDRQSGEAQIQVSPGETVECTFVNEKLSLTVDVDKTGTDAAHHGDTVTYQFAVTNTGNGPLSGVTVDDEILGTDADLCQPTLKSKGTELGTAALMEEGETWTFECTYDLSDTHAAPGEQETPAGTPDEVVNQATASGTGEDDTPVSSESNEHTTLVYHPALELTKLVKVKGSSTAYAPSTQAYAGDTVQFEVSAENTGDAPLDVTELTDVISGAAPSDACELVTAGDDLLAVGETQVWTCEVAITGSVDDFINTATIEGSHELPTSTVTVPGDDSATVDVLHPAIKIDKQGPAKVKAGELIDYTLIVTNPGDVPFASQKVVVTDPRCDEPPVLVTKNGDATPGRLDPGDMWSYTCSVLTNGTTTSVDNTGFVDGTDPNGRKVSSKDSVTTAVERIVVLPEQIEPGSARLSGPSSCVSKAFSVKVRGRRIASVTYKVDGKRVGRKTARAGQTRFAMRIDPRNYGYRVHRLKVRVRFAAGTAPKARTLRMTFQRCARQVVQPDFTG